MGLPFSLTLTVALLLAAGPVGLQAISESRRQQVEQAGRVPKELAQLPELSWFEAVERHEIGRMDGVAEELAGWPTDQMEKVGRGVLSGLDTALRKATPGSEDARRLYRLVNRGVLLHTDIALSGKGAAGVSNLLLAVDGRKEGLGRSMHLEFAAALLNLDADRRGKETARTWFRAVSAYLLHRSRLGEEAVLLALWRESALGQRAPDLSVLPDDDAFLFDYGCLHEGLMAPSARVVLGDVFSRSSAGSGESAGLERSGPAWTRETSTFQTRSADFAVHVEQAFRAYRQVVQMNPRAAEARVRLGHVECVRGSCANGMRDMRAGAELASEDPAVRYYAAMFLGQAQESRRRYEEARRDYERAAALFPLAQSPLLALGALADRTGDRSAARRLVSQLWSLPVDGEHRYDPWWDYDGGPRDGESLIRQVYRLMEGRADDRQ